MTSNLDKAFLARIHEIVFIEHRPFCFLDFKNLQVGRRTFAMEHGTFRNKISQLSKDGIVELCYKSHISFYTIKGKTFGKDTLMTDNHMGSIPVTAFITITELVNFIQDLPYEKKSIHDIHMKFYVPDIWKIISFNKKLSVNQYSKDIKLEPLVTSNLKIQTTIHHTDTVSVVIGCSSYPVVLEDIHGIIRLSIALTRVEERLSKILDECGEKLPGGYERIPIPSSESWLITLWHFGRDTITEYRGKGFAFTWGYGREALYRVYSKEKNGKTIIRSEIQENPNKPIRSLY